MWMKGNKFKPTEVLINWTIAYASCGELGYSWIDLRKPKRSGMIIVCAIDDTDMEYLRRKGLIEYKEEI